MTPANAGGATGHTPGPWTVVFDPCRKGPDGSRGMLTSIYAKDRDDDQVNRCIAMAYSDIQGWPLSDAVLRLVVENAEANARLIAAAPALLAFVEKVKDGWRNTYGEADAAAALGEACGEAERLLAALSQARGGGA